jgi:hypothetical protein
VTRVAAHDAPVLIARVDLLVDHGPPEGTNALIYIGPTGMPSMGKFLGATLVYDFLVSLCAGYVAKAALDAGAP